MSGRGRGRGGGNWLKDKKKGQLKSAALPTPAPAPAPVVRKEAPVGGVKSKGGRGGKNWLKNKKAAKKGGTPTVTAPSSAPAAAPASSSTNATDTAISSTDGRFRVPPPVSLTTSQLTRASAWDANYRHSHLKVVEASEERVVAGLVLPVAEDSFIGSKGLEEYTAIEFRAHVAALDARVAGLEKVMVSAGAYSETDAELQDCESEKAKLLKWLNLHPDKDSTDEEAMAKALANPDPASSEVVQAVARVRASALSWSSQLVSKREYAEVLRGGDGDRCVPSSNAVVQSHK